MPVRTILFDLDGTLLPMDQDVFVQSYFKRLAMKLAPHGYEPRQLIQSIWAGTTAMIQNDGSCTNEEAFWRCFAHVYGEGSRQDEPIFEAFYRSEFQAVAADCGHNPLAGQTIRALRDQGYRLVLATNPIFPAIATESRMRWAGLDQSDFELCTTYENIGYCKPNPEYYREILRRIGCEPEECLMVGNDVSDDMVAREIGMDVFLLTDCLINKENVDISIYPHGSFSELMAYVSR